MTMLFVDSRWLALAGGWFQEEQQPNVLGIVIALVVAILLVILLIWYIRREQGARTQFRASESKLADRIDQAAQATPSRPVARPMSVAEATPSKIDDLEIIEGIGPKIAGVLKQAGITSFAQLAAMTPTAITAILQAANMRLADPTSWPEQARLADAGDTAGLQALQDKLKGGRNE